VKRLTFKADYDISSCDLLDGDASKSVLKTTLTQRKNQIQKICSNVKYFFTEF